MKFLLGQRDEDQIDDNLYHITPSSILKISYKLQKAVTYSPQPIEPINLPAELVIIILDLMMRDFLKSFNYELATELLLVSKTVFMKFYQTYIEPDILVSHSISIGTKFYRMVGLLLAAERMHEKLYSGRGVIFQLDAFLQAKLKQQVPMPWDIMTIKPFLSLSPPVILEKSTIYSPHILRFSNANAFLGGEFSNSVVSATYFRLPVVVLSLFTFTGVGPVVTENLIKTSQSWKSLFKILRLGLGTCSGIYHSVNLASLPDEYIFHDEIYIES